MSMFHLSIITPQGEVFSGEIESLVVPGEAGYLGVMANHAPMIAALQCGALVARTGSHSQYYATGHGVLEVENNNALVLIDEAVPAKSQEEASAKAQTLNA